MFSSTFSEYFDKKFAFFWRALHLKFSIHWRQRRLQKNFRVGRPKMNFLKSTKGVFFFSATKLIFWKSGPKKAFQAFL